MAEHLDPNETVVIPVVEEKISIGKRVVETGHVRVDLTTDIAEVMARETLRGRRVEVERVPLGQTLPEGAATPAVREVGDTLIIPVIEEVAVVVKRRVLTEEVRLRFIPIEQPFEQAVTVRRQKATVARIPINREEESS